VAILAKSRINDKPFDLNIADICFETKGYECKKCPNNCEIICFYKDNELVDAWGNRCVNGDVMALSNKK
jgi:hypothetical protein